MLKCNNKELLNLLKEINGDQRNCNDCLTDQIKKREYVMKLNTILKQKTQSSHREKFYAQLLRNEVN